MIASDRWFAESMVKSVAGAYDEMNPERLPEYIQFLMNADVYPHPVDEVRLLQTHISFVVLAGPFVYKWKKPVDFGFLNFFDARSQALLLRAGTAAQSPPLSG